MNTLYEAFTAALFHFLWQGAAIAALLSVALLALRRSSSSSRYLAACVALALMVILPAVTTIVLFEPQRAAATAAGAAQAVAIAPEAVGASVVDAETAGAAPASVFDVLSVSLAGLREWAIPVWLLGILLFSLRLLWAYRYVIGLREKAAVSDAKTLAVARSVAERMGIARPFGVIISSLVDGPSVIGWWRPVILLPSATLLGLTPWQLEAVLAHELAHIRRCDYLVNLLQSVVEVLLFYHPAVWWVSNCLRRERELCCDDLAVVVSGDAVGYARALTILERQRLTVPPMQLAIAATRPTMAAAGGWLGLRVRRLVGLVQDPNRPTLVSGLLALSLAIGILAIAVGSADSVAQEGAREPNEASPVAEPVEPRVDGVPVEPRAGAEPVEPRAEPIEPEPIEVEAIELEGIEVEPVEIEVIEVEPLELRISQALEHGVTLQHGATLEHAQEIELSQHYAQAVAPEDAANPDRLLRASDVHYSRWMDTVTWRGQWSDVDRVTRAARLSDLSEAQLAGVEAIVGSYGARIATSAARVQSDEAHLETLLTAEVVDRAAISSTLESLTSARGELDRTSADMALAVRERLTRDEWIRMQQHLEGTLGLYFRTLTATPR